MMRSGLHIIDDADKTPPPAPGRHPLAPISGESFQERPRRLPAQAWVILTVVVLIPVSVALVALWRLAEETVNRYPWTVDILGLSLFCALLVLIVSGVLWSLSYGQAALQHKRILRTRHGVPVNVGLQLALNPSDLEAQTIALEVARAPYLQHPNLSTQSVTGMAPQKPADVPLLANPIDVSPVPVSTWLNWLQRVPHVMLAAETGGGKTTLATHILKARLDDVRARAYIIDPGASGWGGLPSVGGGEDWAAVKQAMINVIALYATRQKKRAERLTQTGYELPHDFFAPLTVVMDEAYIAKLNLGSGKGNVWDRFVPVLGSGARKVGISVILLTQTANVEDLAISGPLRENYTRIALDSGAAIKFIQRTETESTRKQALIAAIQGVPFPAVTEQNGKCVILDRTGLDTLPSMRSLIDRTWQPKPASQPRTQEQDTLDMLRRLKADGYTREQARATGVQFTNSDWSEV